VPATCSAGAAVTFGGASAVFPHAIVVTARRQHATLEVG
jgi:hypothetical protein